MLQKKRGWVRAVAVAGFTTAVAAMMALAGCGGGGSGSNSTTSSNSTGSGSSGSTGGSSGSLIATSANQATVTVGFGFGGVWNIPTVSVTVCAPGGSSCATINNVQVDTGSTGLRLTANALGSIANVLPHQTVGGQNLAECMQFADGNAWGTVRLADVTLGGETASSVPVQVIGDTSPPSGACAAPLQQTSTDIGANGIIGIGNALTDCPGCAVSIPSTPLYFTCVSTASCTSSTVAAAKQVANPIGKLATDNTGVIIQMPPLTSAGSNAVTGVMTFGIGTQSNNALPSSGVTKYGTTTFGDVSSASANGTSYSSAFFDTGSNAYFYADSITTCSTAPAFYCPSSPVSRTATVTGNNSATGTVSMSIGNALALNGTGYAFNNLAGGAAVAGALDFGMSFFYGKTVYFGYDLTGSGGASPYVAF